MIVVAKKYICVASKTWECGIEKKDKKTLQSFFSLLKERVNLNFWE